MLFQIVIDPIYPVSVHYTSQKNKNAATAIDTEG